MLVSDPSISPLESVPLELIRYTTRRVQLAVILAAIPAPLLFTGDKPLVGRLTTV
jgi:hypothetical protein